MTAIFVLLQKQRRLYKKYEIVVKLDGTYSIGQSGFALYHILVEDNNGESQPVAFFFIKEETIEAISACLKVFADVRIIIASPKGEANNRIRRKKKAMSLCLYVCMSRSITQVFYDRFRTFWF